MKNILNAKNLFSVLVITGLFVLSAACSKQPSENQATPVASASSQNTDKSASDFETAYTTADNLRLEAAALEYEWRDTEKFLLEAKTTFASGDKDKAMQLVNKAHQQAVLAIAQAKDEETGWKLNVPK